MLFSEGCIFSLYLKKVGFPLNTEIGHRDQIRNLYKSEGYGFFFFFAVQFLKNFAHIRIRISMHLWAEGEMVILYFAKKNILHEQSTQWTLNISNFRDIANQKNTNLKCNTISHTHFPGKYK